MTTMLRVLAPVALLVGLVLAAAVPVAAKGPGGATIEGPGGGPPVDVPGPGEPGETPLGDLVDAAGFFPAIWQQTPDPMRDTAPTGDLGPRWTVTWQLGPEGGGASVVQHLYPLAEPRPVTYVEPGVELGEPGLVTRGGWYVSTPALVQALEDVGIDVTAPPEAPADATPGALPLWPWVMAGVAAGALAVGARRRFGRPAAAGA